MDYLALKTSQASRERWRRAHPEHWCLWRRARSFCGLGRGAGFANGLAATLTAMIASSSTEIAYLSVTPSVFVVTRLTLKLSTRFEPVLAYQDLQNLPAQSTASPQGLSARIQSIRAQNCRTIGFRNVGSFFKNPILSEAGYRDARASAGYQRMPECAGQGIGCRINSSSRTWRSQRRSSWHIPKHHLVLENRGGATLLTSYPCAS